MGESGVWLGKILVDDICFAKFSSFLLPEFYTIQCVLSWPLTHDYVLDLTHHLTNSISFKFDM